MEAPQTVLPTVLAGAHQRKGAEMGLWFGCALPNHFGNWEAEYHMARETVALVDKNYRAYLEFTGPDRLRYLNAILTNDIKSLKPQHGNVSLFLNPQGHIQAEIETYAQASQFFCVSFAMIRERLIAGLDKYIIMDDVTLNDRTDAYATRRVPRRMNDVRKKASPRKRISLFQQVVDFHEFRGTHPEECRLRLHAAIQGKVVTMHHHRRARVLMEPRESADMVDMSVRADDCLHHQFVPA